MTARPGDLQVTSKHAKRAQSALAAFLGALAVLLWQYIPEAPAAPPVSDAPLIAACRLPSANGEMTVFIVESGKIKCWRWR